MPNFDIARVSDLEIFIITYNRPDDLERTLLCLMASSFSAFNVTVLDNSSDTCTYEAVEAIQGDFPKLRYIRNLANISGQGNFLQALLLSRSYYTWVICDDDRYDFNDSLDVLNAISARQVDLLLVGGHPQDCVPSQASALNVQDLVASGNHYFRDSSFLPALIYRTEFILESFIHCMEFSSFLYPHMALVVRAYKENSLIYVSKNQLITPIYGGAGYSTHEQISAWSRMCGHKDVVSLRKEMLCANWTGPLDPSGLYGYLNNCIRNSQYIEFLKALVVYKHDILISFARMLRNKFLIGRVNG